MSIEDATEVDLPQILELVESCYISDLSRTGWTTAADMVEGARSTIESLKKDLNAPGGKFLKYTDENGKISGCVYSVIIPSENKFDISLLCVHPTIQSKGLGKTMMTAIENYGKSVGCSQANLTVVTIRTSLIAWYERQGYRHTGEITSFTADDGVCIPKFPLEFSAMVKDLE